MRGKHMHALVRTQLNGCTDATVGVNGYADAFDNRVAADYPVLACTAGLSPVVSAKGTRNRLNGVSIGFFQSDHIRVFISDGLFDGTQSERGVNLDVELHHLQR